MILNQEGIGLSGIFLIDRLRTFILAFLLRLHDNSPPSLSLSLSSQRRAPGYGETSKNPSASRCKSLSWIEITEEIIAGNCNDNETGGRGKNVPFTIGWSLQSRFFSVSPIGRSNPHLVSRSRVTRQSSVVHSVIWTGSSIFTKYRVRRAFDLPSGRRQFIVYTRVYTRGRLIEQWNVYGASRRLVGLNLCETGKYDEDGLDGERMKNVEYMYIYIGRMRDFEREREKEDEDRPYRYARGRQRWRKVWLDPLERRKMGGDKGI